MQVKKIRHQDLVAFDREHDDCTVRELEMVVDSATGYNIGLTLQFWSDAKVYDVEEAIAYLPDDFKGRVLKTWKGIKSRMATAKT